MYNKYHTVLQSVYTYRRGYIMWSVYLGLMERSCTVGSTAC